MRFLWDNGNTQHIARHAVTPQEAQQVVENGPFDAGLVFRNGETRAFHLVETDAGRVLMAIVTERDGMFRVVTARPDERKERAFI